MLVGHVRVSMVEFCIDDGALQRANPTINPKESEQAGPFLLCPHRNSGIPKHREPTNENKSCLDAQDINHGRYCGLRSDACIRIRYRDLIEWATDEGS